MFFSMLACIIAVKVLNPRNFSQAHLIENRFERATFNCVELVLLTPAVGIPFTIVASYVFEGYGFWQESDKIVEGVFMIGAAVLCYYQLFCVGLKYPVKEDKNGQGKNNIDT